MSAAPTVCALAPVRASRSLRRFTFVRVAAVLWLLLMMMGLAGYLLVTRPSLEHRAATLATTLLPAGPLDCAGLRTHLAALSKDQLHTGVGLLPGANAASTLQRGGWLLPVDDMLVEQLRQHKAVIVQARSGIDSLHLRLQGVCADAGIALTLHRRTALGVAPAQALAAWLAGLLAGTLGLAAWLSRALNAPLFRLEGHVRQTPLGGRAAPAPATGIIELDRLALAVDGLRARAGAAVASRTALLMAMSHELRTPLARVRLILDTAQPVTGDDATEIRAYLLEMQDALDEFMRAANAMAAPPQHAGAQAVWLRLQTLFSDPRVRFQPATGAWDTALNAAALLRIASNLIDNALRHGTGRVEVSWHQHAEAWCLQVRDEGPGIAPAQMLQALQPFSSGAASEAGVSSHAGLGLALASILCEHNGWTLQLENRQPQGLLVSVAHGPVGLSG